MVKGTDPMPGFAADSASALVKPAVVGDLPERLSEVRDTSDAGELSAVDLVIGLGEPQRVGRFRFFFDGQRWEWSDAVACMHGYEPGAVEPSTELLLRHKHPDDRKRVAAVLGLVLRGEPFSGCHRIIDTAGRTHWVVVVGGRMLDDNGAIIGASGFYIDITEVVRSNRTITIWPY